MTDGILFPTESSNGSQSKRTIDRRALRRMMLDMLGRPPLASEHESWVGKDREELIEWALPGSEFWKHWLEEQLYYFLLIDGFMPTNDTVESLPEQLAEGKLGVMEALHRICLSSSFDRRNPGPDTFVTVVMEQLLGLTVQRTKRELEIGKKVYDGGRGVFLGQPGSSQADVVHIAIQDERAPRHYLLREYQRLIRGVPAARELSAWEAELGSKRNGHSGVLRDWFLSEAYDRRLESAMPQPNRLFIRSLFVDLLGELPGEEEAGRMRSALDGLADSGPLRSIVSRLILDSGQVTLPEKEALPDAAAWIRDSFERLLGRVPTDPELDVFLKTFEEPACRPATVLYAIVSHPEYQSW